MTLICWYTSLRWKLRRRQLRFKHFHWLDWTTVKQLTKKHCLRNREKLLYKLFRWASAHVADNKCWSCRVHCAVQCAHDVRELHVVCVHVVHQWPSALRWVQLVCGIIPIRTVSRMDHSYCEMSRFGYRLFVDDIVLLVPLVRTDSGKSWNIKLEY